MERKVKVLRRCLHCAHFCFLPPLLQPFSFHWAVKWQGGADSCLPCEKSANCAATTTALFWATSSPNDSSYVTMNEHTWVTSTVHSQAHNPQQLTTSKTKSQRPNTNPKTLGHAWNVSSSVGGVTSIRFTLRLRYNSNCPPPSAALLPSRS